MFNNLIKSICVKKKKKIKLQKVIQKLPLQKLNIIILYTYMKEYNIKRITMFTSNILRDIIYLN
jgi:hypothetical protein